MTERPPDRFRPEDAPQGWFAYTSAPGGTGRSEDPSPPPPGTVISLMGEHTVEVPLWSDEGLLFGDRAELVTVLGVSRGLADDLAAWGNGWEDRRGQPEHDAEAADLVRRLRRELEPRSYTFVFRP